MSIDTEPDLLRRAILVATAALPIGTPGLGLAMAPETLPAGAVGDFDFLRGDWQVRHSAFIASRWQAFEGECSSRPLMAGQVNVDDNIWRFEGKTFRALAVRIFDPRTAQWSIFWLDARFPENFGPPILGGFRGNTGEFYGDDQLDGRPIRVRFSWTVESASLAHWEQAFSSDGGNKWEPNWRMRFERLRS